MSQDHWPYYAKLVGKEVVPLSRDATMTEKEDWADWSANINNRIVRQTPLKNKTITVSTVFLGINHGGFWFETLVIDGEMDGYMERYRTFDEALEGHIGVVALVMSGALKESCMAEEEAWRRASDYWKEKCIEEERK